MTIPTLPFCEVGMTDDGDVFVRVSSAGNTRRQTVTEIPLILLRQSLNPRDLVIDKVERLMRSHLTPSDPAFDDPAGLSAVKAALVEDILRILP